MAATGTTTTGPFLVPCCRGGRWWITRERWTLRDVRGEPLAELAWAPAAFFRDALVTASGAGRAALHQLPLDELLAILREASLRLAGTAYGGAGDRAWPSGGAGTEGPRGTPPWGTPGGPEGAGLAVGSREAYEAHLQRVVRATGLPYAAARASHQHLVTVLRHMDEILKRQVPDGRLALLDGIQPHPHGLRWVPRGRHVAVVAPGNDPNVHVWWCLALAMKFPVVLRPSHRDPFTPAHLAAALLAAGLPGPALHVLPGSHEHGLDLLRRADLALAFGDEQLVRELGEARRRSVKVFGPGRSTAVVAADRVDDGEVLAHLVRGITRAGGRACFNLSRIVVAGSGAASHRLALALAERLSAIPLYPPLDERAVIPAAPAATVERLDAAIRQNLHGGASDLTAGIAGDRRVELDGWAFLRPTVVWIPPQALARGHHPLFTELPFPYCAVSAVQGEPAELAAVLRGSLLVAAFVDDPHLLTALLEEPGIDRVYHNRYPGEIELTRPHHGFLADFLFHKGTWEPGFA